MVQYNQFVILIWWLARPIHADDWCSPKLSCFIDNRLVGNTMCIYPDRFNSSNCKNLTNVQSDSRRQSIVSNVNSARLAFSAGRVPGWPSASNMRRVSYDMELEQMAFRWAQQCRPTKDTCRRTLKMENVEQIIVSEGSLLPIDPAKRDPGLEVQTWYREFEVADPGAILKKGYLAYRDDPRFSQLIWAETERIGCADVLFEPVGDYPAEESYQRLFICNFAVGGNIEGQPPYKIGPTCSACDTVCLCNASDIPELIANTVVTSDRIPVHAEISTEYNYEEYNFFNAKDREVTAPKIIILPTSKVPIPSVRVRVVSLLPPEVRVTGTPLPYKYYRTFKSWVRLVDPPFPNPRRRHRTSRACHPTLSFFSAILLFSFVAV